MWWSRPAALVLAAALLAACGFRPLYGEQPHAAAPTKGMQSIAIGPIPDRVGQLLRNGLLDRLAPRGAPDNPRYRLDVALTSTSEALAITQADEITRTNLKFTAFFVLRDLETGETVLEGRTRSAAAFNIVQSDFANVIAEQDAQQRMARMLSEQITRRLALFFTRQRSS